MPFAISKLHSSALVAAAFALSAALTGSAEASIISTSPSLPLIGIPYLSASGAGCFDAAGVCVLPGPLVQTSLVSSDFTSAGQDIVTNAVYQSTLTTLTGTPIGTIKLTGTVEQLIEGRTSDLETGSWMTELTNLSLSGSVLGATLSAMLDPSNPSTGTTSVEPLGERGFTINSFFDVFVDLSLNTGLSTSVGPILTTAVPVPEPSIWALMLIGFAGLGVAARRHARV